MQNRHERPKSGQLTLSLKDVCCQCCDSAIRDTVTSIQGMTSIDIDYAKNAVTVNYDPEKASPEKISESLQKAGFELNVDIDEITGGSVAESVHDHHASMVQKGKANELRMKVIVSGVIFVLVFLGSFPQWFPWMPDFLKNILFFLHWLLQYSSGLVRNFTKELG
jgi:copper chaperone CopZ